MRAQILGIRIGKFLLRRAHLAKQRLRLRILSQLRHRVGFFALQHRMHAHRRQRALLSFGQCFGALKCLLKILQCQR